MEKQHLLKLILKTGQVVGLYCEEYTKTEILSHPKFLRLNDKVNDIYVSIEDIAALEVLSDRKQPEAQPTEGIIENQTERETQQS